MDSISMLEPNCIKRIWGSRFLNHCLRLSFIVGSSATLTGCPVAADLQDPESFALAQGLSCNISAVLTKSCFGIGCHGSNVPAAMMDLQSAGVESRIVNVAASHADILDGTQANCMAGELRINTASIEDSVILKKIDGRQS
ncbi:MAG TPA: hypothetical protein VGP93_16445, partial [Polyangiaceae bacterium]|nr:hypothetical protein [Polyangiaceae bacterium]